MAGRPFERPHQILEGRRQAHPLLDEAGENASRHWVRTVVTHAAARYDALKRTTGSERPGQSLEQAAAYFRGWDARCSVRT